VTAAYASDLGDLLLEFGEEASLVVPFGPDFEAWSIAGLDGMRVVSVAGGGLAAWD